MKIAAVALVALAGIASAGAHHSIAAFDGRTTVKITGVVKEFRWINPHVIIEVEGVSGVTAGRWSVEMSAPNTMMEAGWHRGSLIAGDRITLFANPLRNATAAGGAGKRMFHVGIILPFGKTFGRIGEH